MKALMRPEPSLNELAALITIIEHRSLRRASEATGISRVALNQLVLRLEDTLGAQLFKRSRQSITLTEPGARLVANIQPLLQDFAANLRGLLETPVNAATQLRIATDKDTASLLMRGVIQKYLAHDPDRRVQLISYNEGSGPVPVDVDAIIGIGMRRPEGMTAVELGAHLRYAAVASPSYMVGQTTSTDPYSLNSHRCIGVLLPNGDSRPWRFNKLGKRISVEIQPVLALPDDDFALQAAVDGLGVAYILQAHAQNYLDEKRLILPFPGWNFPAPNMMMFCNAEPADPSPLSEFVKVLKKVTRKDVSGHRSSVQPTADKLHLTPDER
ncbi:LysR family transcriptional regulator [Lichenicoccus roseus]|uniref:LysR family transcriptional regulator n=1 Tax=Lichenicoccus roseus TaxID=2683649 RepID=A0A5R9J0F0_9PROT|nr:LysR family transcriptional regulator [Lichenicoccus roseus]TLU71145.1 LysR family transcriptional regulator [Lichenicoccus roseus]